MVGGSQDPIDAIIIYKILFTFVYISEKIIVGVSILVGSAEVLNINLTSYHIFYQTSLPNLVWYSHRLFPIRLIF